MPAAVGRTPVPPTAAVPPHRGRAYRGREAVLATRHGKQVAVAPAMSVLGLRVSVPPGLDTDALGTFTGEVARAGTPVQAALRKARLGMAVAGCPLGLASEGSFGPLPDLPWLTADTEVLVFVDATLPAADGAPLVVVEALTSVDTNAVSCRVRSTAELSGFLERVGFPGVGLVVRPAGGPAGGAPVEKGIRDRDALARAVGRAVHPSAGGQAVVETDLRAHQNPTRMGVIAEVARRLARRLGTPCPACGVPGFGAVEAGPGLPCAVCGTPSERVRAGVLGCARCAFRLVRQSPGSAAPVDCPACNP